MRDESESNPLTARRLSSVLLIASFAFSQKAHDAQAAESEGASEIKPYLLETCFVSGKKFGEGSIEFESHGRVIRICCEDCEADFEKSPQFYLPKLEAAEKKALDATAAAKTVSVARFDELRADKKSQVIDLRPAKEFESGHIPGALRMDTSPARFEEQLAKMDLARAYLLYCAKGDQSARAARMMEIAGFTSVHILEGGYAAWEKAGNKGTPFTKPAPVP